MKAGPLHEALERLRAVPWRLWGRLLRLAGRDFLVDDGPSWAAPISYYSLLSLFPLLLAIGSVAAFFVKPQWAVKQATYYLGQFLPRGSVAVDRIVLHTITAAKEGGLLSIFPLLWTGSLVFGAVVRGLNIVFESRERLAYGKRLLQRLVMLLTVGVVFLIALGSPVALEGLRWVFGILPIGQELLYQLVVSAVPPIFVFGAFLLSYRYVPRTPPAWYAVVAGALAGAALFACAKPLFLGYLKWLARYSAIYGSLAGIIVVVLWIWIVAMIGLFGAQITAHAHSVFITGLPIDEVERHHLQHVGRARFS